MTNDIQETTITEDDEPFFIQQGLVDKTLESVRAQLDKVSLVTECIDCGEDIGAAPSGCMYLRIDFACCLTAVRDSVGQGVLVRALQGLSNLVKTCSCVKSLYLFS